MKQPTSVRQKTHDTVELEACAPQESQDVALARPSEFKTATRGRGTCEGAALTQVRDHEICLQLATTPPAVASPGDLLIEAIADAVVRKLDQSRNRQRRLVEVDYAATYLGMSVTALRQKAGIEIPVIRIDKKLRFDLVDLDRYIDRAKRKGI